MSLGRRRTLGELRYRNKLSLTVARKWSTDFSTNMLASVWKGVDLLSEEVFTFDPSQAEDDLERTITEWLEPRIKKFISDLAPYYLQLNTGERETRSPAPAQPPQYDMAFVFWENEEFKWPIEAKVLKSDTRGAVARYVKCLKEKFLTFGYAPFSSEAAMLGYLFKGDPAVAFKSIANRVPCELTSHPEFPERQHMISAHSREVPENKQETYPAEFRCHHLVMSIKQWDSKKEDF